MAARTAYTRVDGSGVAAPTTLGANITASATSLSIGSGEASSWPTGAAGRFLICIARDTALEEKVWATSRSGQTVSFDVADRGADDTTAAAHSSGVAVEVVIGWDHVDEANKAVVEVLSKATTAGQLPYVSAAQTYTMISIGASGRVLVSNGSIPVWVAMSGDGTISSAGVLTIGADKVLTTMIADAELKALAGLASAADKLPYFTGSGTAALADLTTYGRSLIDDADAATARATLGFAGAGGTVQSANILDGTLATADLADDAVTLAKMAAAAKPRWSVGAWSILATDITTDTRLYRFGYGISTTDANRNPYVCPEAGSIVGLSVSCNDTRTAGTMTFEVTKNGVGTGFTLVFDGTHLQYVYATQAETADTFVAGDLLGITATTSSFTPTSNVVFNADLLLQAV